MDFKRVILVGPGGSGKDYAAKLLMDFKFLNFRFKMPLMVTTRPMRPNEKQGIDYRFTPKDIFLRQLEFNFFKYWNSYGSDEMEWYYGLPEFEFNDSTNNLFICTPKYLKQLQPSEIKESIVLYFDIDEDVRYSRMEKRKDADDATRRIASDRIDFKDFEEYNIKIENENFTLDMLIECILKVISLSNK